MFGAASNFFLSHSNAVLNASLTCGGSWLYSMAAYLSIWKRTTCYEQYEIPFGFTLGISHRDLSRIIPAVVFLAFNLVLTQAYWNVIDSAGTEVKTKELGNIEFLNWLALASILIPHFITNIIERQYPLQISPNTSDFNNILHLKIGRVAYDGLVDEMRAGNFSGCQLSDFFELTGMQVKVTRGSTGEFQSGRIFRPLMEEVPGAEEIAGDPIEEAPVRGEASEEETTSGCLPQLLGRCS